MAVTAKQVKELRDITGAGMLDCKKALEETNGDIEKAVVLLREKGMAQAAKKSSRIAAEGLCNVVTEGNVSILYELNSETDFVAKNDKFLNLLDLIGKALIKNQPNNTEEALEVVYEGKTVDQILVENTSTIGEKLSLRRVTKVVKEDDQIFSFYKHMGGRIVSLVVASENEEVAKDIAMQVAAQRPKYLNRDEIEESYIESERQILLNQALLENKEEAKPKPEHIIEKMVVGRLNKQLQEICLLDQVYVKDTSLTVSKYLKQQNVTVHLFKRLEVGEGIEKREEDFAAEVSAQLKG